MIRFSMLFALVGCADEAGNYRPTPGSVPAIRDLGEFRVIPTTEVVNADWSSYAEASVADDDLGRHSVHYTQLGAPENQGIYGGATLTFKGTGGLVCVVMDPETVFWIQSRKPIASAKAYLYQDDYDDDGDLDLEGGLTAYYNGSPGVKIGKFEVPYTDATGQDHTLPANECRHDSPYASDVHAGRATVETCQLDTSERGGVSYTALLKTFVLPIDDSVLNYGVAVFEGACADLLKPADECLIERERTRDEDEIDCSDPELNWTYACLEQKFCSSPLKFNTYCEEHLNDADTPCTDNGHVPEAVEDTAGSPPL